MGRHYKKLSDYVSQELLVTAQAPVLPPPPAFGLTEDALHGRCLMLYRMKRTLICDWHPIIDVLLNDYSKELARLQALREPLDPADIEPDVLDRDEGA